MNGIFITPEILYDPYLISVEKIVLSMIKFFTEKKKQFYFDPIYLLKEFPVDEKAMINILERLQLKKYIDYSENDLTNEIYLEYKNV